MKKSVAIASLKQQANKLNDSEYVKKLTWRTQTEALIKKYFGPESSQFQFIKAFVFNTGRDANYGSTHDLNNEYNQKIAKAKTFINECIEHIEQFGLYTPQRQNFLYSLPGVLVWAIFIGCIGATYAISTNLNNNKFESLNLKLEKAEDSIKKLHIALTFPDTITNKKADIHK